MLPPGSIERTPAKRWGPGVALATLLVLTGCSVVGGGDAGGSTATASQAQGPDAAAVAQYEAALTHLRGGDESAAFAALKEMAGRYPEYAGSFLNLGLLESRRGHDGRALAYLERAAAVCQQCGAVYNELGVIRRRQGRFEDAEAAYRQAMQLEPSYGLSYYNLAVLYELYEQRPELALALYQQYLETGADPSLSPEVEKWVADLRRRTQAPEKAARAEGES